MYKMIQRDDTRKKNIKEFIIAFASSTTSLYISRDINNIMKMFQFCYLSSILRFPFSFPNFQNPKKLYINFAYKGDTKWKEIDNDDDDNPHFFL